MAVSMIYLDDHGERVAELISDITYKSEGLGYLSVHNKTWILHYAEDTVLFECGSDKRGFKKYNEMEHNITFYVRLRGFRNPHWRSKYYPEENTIYISPEENDINQSEYYSLCYRQAEEKMRALATLASVSGYSYIIIDFSDFKSCFSQAVFVDAFTIEKPGISQINDAVNEAVARCKEELNGLEKTNVMIYIQVPDNAYESDVKEPLKVVKESFPDSKVVLGLGFNNSSSAAVSVTAGISYRYPKREAKQCEHIDTIFGEQEDFYD